MLQKIVIVILTVIMTAWVSLDIGKEIYNDSFLESQDIEKMPTGYLEPAFEKGTLKTVSYKSSMILPDKAPGEKELGYSTLTKRAMVYLPYDYDPHKHYNIFYLIHGRGGSYKTWLGTASNPSQFKNLMDHMIEDGIIAPMIVVTPGLNYRYETDNKRMAGISHEVAYELMPAVESKYSSFAEDVSAKSHVSTNAKAFAGSRDHRIVGGFSMGGSATWHIMKNHIAWFRYFIPMSMAMYYDDQGYARGKSVRAAENIVSSIERQGYGPNDFQVYVATGEYDHKADAADMQVFDLTASRFFKYTDEGYKKGNVMFKMWPERWHSYRESFPYVYNALLKFGM